MATKKKNGLAHRLYTGQVSYDFVGTRKRWYTVSAVLIGIALLALLVRGLNLGIEFSGGADFQAPTRVTSTTVDEVRTAVRNTNLPEMDSLSVTTIGDNTVRVQTRTLDAQTEVPQVREAIASELNINPDQVAYSLIGASWGKQITQQGLIALAVFLALVMIMIWIYFRDLKMSIAAIVALIHDLLVTVGIYALVGFTFTPATLIGLLTILGYSLYDTVVVFDKVRENVKDLRKTKRTYSVAANDAVNQVLVRSINTTVIAVLPIAALLVAGAFILGTGPLKDLGLALFVGMLAGAYSSIFIATPLLVGMKERESGMKEHRERIARREGRRRGKDREPSNSELAAAEAEVNAMQDPDSPADLRGSRDDEWDTYDGDEDGSRSEGELAGPLSRTRITTVRTSGASRSGSGSGSGSGDGDRGRTREVGESGSARRPQPRNTSRSQRKK
ncbi:protein translocase subunit SecF [Enemella evansiae]|uniref:Protein-export membrane protein SecF n=1 Tax=Enemella evansiae TaxID=2016499 RepID=A0A255GSA8_9ACTN|nr:protein translocase subunit SecF [Enemella evansiae]OYO15894.1 protein translocase subunit SecF [Enemella evansiae]TDO93222.1 protein translocase subunit secF [Enemella evansiae]